MKLHGELAALDEFSVTLEVDGRAGVECAGRLDVGDSGLPSVFRLQRLLQQLQRYLLGCSRELLTRRWVAGCDQAHQVETVNPFSTAGGRATGADLPECTDGVALELA